MRERNARRKRHFVPIQDRHAGTQRGRYVPRDRKTEIRLYRAAGGQLLFRRKSEDHHNDGDARQKEIRKDFPRGRRRLCRLDLARRAGTCFKIFGKNVSRTFV